MGEKIDGYEKPAILLTEKAAIALERVQRQLMEEGVWIESF